MSETVYGKEECDECGALFDGPSLVSTQHNTSCSLNPANTADHVYDVSNLPEGLSPWRGKPGEIEIQDAQGYVWVTLHAGANGDPIKWRNTITTAVFVALGIDAREYAK